MRSYGIGKGMVKLERKDCEQIKMNEKEVFSYIEQLQQYGSVPGLDSIRELCARLGNPQDSLVFIHVAGTNGKGSVTAYLTGVLMETGVKVGRYNSPTIRDWKERIMVGRQKIAKEPLCRLMSRIRKVCDEMAGEGLPHPTSFEVETVLGFLYFLEKGCDLVILETGMGGALDATNIIGSPKVAVLTSISMDHMAFLGDTLPEIAAQKAGIIKEGCQVVTMPQEPACLRVIKEVCRQKHANLTVAPEVCDGQIDRVRYGVEKQSFRYKKRLQIEVPLIGTFQIENAGLAITVCEVLQSLGYAISDAQIQKGIKNTVWHARFEVLSKKPYFIIDGAHNEDAARKLAQSLEFYFTNKKIVFIMGILKDKEYEKIIRLTAPLAESIITVKTPDNPRAMDAYELAKEVARFHPKVTAAGSIEEAVEMSYLLADQGSVILAFGSLSYLGRVMDIMEKRKKTKRNGR